MRSKVYLGVFAAVLLSAGAAGAQTEMTPGAPRDVPTVTIINKSAAADSRSVDEASPPTLTVSPGAPERPSAAAAPASAGAPATPGAPSAPSVAGVPAQPGTAAAATPAASAASPADPSPSAEAAALQPPPEPTLAIDIDLTKQSMNVSENGVHRFTWPISSARYGYSTPTGTFRPTWMSKMWYSRQYDYAPMPHAVFFHQGVAIHGSYATRMLGTPASHGCVRLAPKNAATLFNLVNGHGKERTQIVVHGTPSHSGARVAYDDYPREVLPMRRASQYRYLPPSYYARGYSGYGASPSAYYAPARGRRGYAAQQRRIQPRGLYNGNSYGYGF
ncbi:L,D-transpeptidase [Hyphomicrobium sp.]|uniref:L,D-transpeptidase n=1 Tax=Hyphomicrobium sp. TaxID=82 RepID=UPI002E2EC4AF|nr:L,D-transpeptidase [Hyphomicrobium sp.]HEX2843517.1 L,D-transpeptidase [Hyphomicrobium sp.]